VGKITKKNSLKECIFVNSALKINTAFSAILPTGYCFNLYLAYNNLYPKNWYSTKDVQYSKCRWRTVCRPNLKYACHRSKGNWI